MLCGSITDCSIDKDGGFLVTSKQLYEEINMFETVKAIDKLP